jgi:uncharacterized membrane protein YagU involved in acid resistance
MHIAVKRFARGALAGLAATAPMSSVMLLGKAVGTLGEPPPRRLTRLLTRPLGSLAPTGRELDWAALGAHLAFGAAMGVVWELLPRRWHTAPGGAAFGLAVWGVNYAGWLPATGLMPAPSRDRIARPTTMVLAHLMFGAALYQSTRLLAPRSSLHEPTATA